MEVDAVLAIAMPLSLGSVSTFVAVILWSVSRDSAWILVVVGVIIQYAGILYSILGDFGLISEDIAVIPGVLRLETLLESVAIGMVAAGIVVALRQNRLS